MNDAEAKADGHTPIMEFIVNYYQCRNDAGAAEVMRRAICNAPLSWIGYRFLFSYMEEEGDEDEDIDWFVFSGKCDQLYNACWTSGIFGDAGDGIDEKVEGESPVVWPLLEEAE